MDVELILAQYASSNENCIAVNKGCFGLHDLPVKRQLNTIKLFFSRTATSQIYFRRPDVVNYDLLE